MRRDYAALRVGDMFLAVDPADPNRTAKLFRKTDKREGCYVLGFVSELPHWGLLPHFTPAGEVSVLNDFCVHAWVWMAPLHVTEYRLQVTVMHSRAYPTCQSYSKVVAWVSMHGEGEWHGWLPGDGEGHIHVGEFPTPKEALVAVEEYMGLTGQVILDPYSPVAEKG